MVAKNLTDQVTAIFEQFLSANKKKKERDELKSSVENNISQLVMELNSNPYVSKPTSNPCFVQRTDCTKILRKKMRKTLFCRDRES